jgi:hypothetical protein
VKLDTTLRLLRRRPDDPPLVGAQDARWSVISSAVDLQPPSTTALVDVLLQGAQCAAGIELEHISLRCDPASASWVRQWPGEHYRLLAGLVKLLRPRSVVEIGTFQGHGSLALLSGSDVTTVTTYDVIAWDEIDGTVLRPSDFGQGRLTQRIGDLADSIFLGENLDILRAADLIFIDGPKDGVWEPDFCAQVLPLLADRQRLIVLDDIRLLTMVQLWRDLPFAKLDATSLGHWSGTGLVHTR